jgi:glycerol uptake facilitator protein
LIHGERQLIQPGSGVKNKHLDMSPFLAEYIGTTVLLLMGNGVVANVVLTDTKGHNGGWIVIVTGWAMAVYIGIWIANPYSGAHLNPAVSIAMAVAGKLAWKLVPGYVIAQLLGAMTGASLVWLVYRDHFNRTTNPALQLAAFATSPSIRNVVSNLISEIVGTFVLIFTVLFYVGAEIAESKTKIGLGSLGAIPVAFLIWSIGLSLGGTTGYAINPARDLGPRIMHFLLPIHNKKGSNWSYSWIPVLGPIMGGVLAAWIYMSIQ